MTYVVTQACIKCKYTDCVEVCPVDCFFEGENMVVIDPEICIDCGVCVPECPIGAIIPDTETSSEAWVALNKTYARQWPRILQRKETLKEADAWALVEDKFPKYFSPKPASDGGEG